MAMFSDLFSKGVRWVLAGVVAAGLAACGGSGVGSNGTGAAPQGSGAGTVTGFGSVFIDGVAYDDSEAVVLVEESDGSTTSTETKIGQRVEVVYEAGDASRGVARRIRVEAAVIGPVDRVEADVLVVLGQTVHINADPAQGPVTVFDTATGSAVGGDLTDLAAGDPVEVHALRRVVGSAVELWATRVERLDLLARLRVSGVITATSAEGFNLGSLSVRTGSASLLPGNTLPAKDQWVVVYAQPADLAGSVLTARRVRIGERATVPVLEDEAHLGGFVAALADDGSRFEVDGGVVKVLATTRVEPEGAVLAAGRYVRVEGSYDVEGVLVAREIHVQTADDVSELHGTVVQINDSLTTFRVRDTWVDVLDTTVIDWGNCSAGVLADDLYVAVRGPLRRGVLQASSIVCEKEVAASGKVIERHGSVSALDPVARQLTLLHHDDLLIVRWSDSTYFRAPLTAASLQLNDALEVEGRMDGAVLVATKIKPRSGR